MRNPNNLRQELDFTGNEQTYEAAVTLAAERREAARQKVDSYREKVDALNLEAVVIADELASAFQELSVSKVSELQPKHAAILAILRQAAPKLGDLQQQYNAAALAHDGALAELTAGYDHQTFEAAKNGRQVHSPHGGTPYHTPYTGS